MLKKTAVAELRLGTHLHAFEGAWIDHPFWRSRFVIDDEADLRAAQASAVRECWIDTELGLHVAPPRGPEPIEAAPAAAPAAAPPAARNEPITLADELRHAAALCQRSRAAVKSMFAEARLGKALDAQQTAASASRCSTCACTTTKRSTAAATRIAWPVSRSRCWRAWVRCAMSMTR